MSHPVLFRVGYHKTATTWMQKRLFTERNEFQQVADHGDVFNRIVRPHGLPFDAGTTLLHKGLRTIHFVDPDG